MPSPYSFAFALEGVATLTPAAIGNPDNIIINIPALTDDTWIVQLTGGGGIALEAVDIPPIIPPTTYCIYATWYWPTLRSLNNDGFTAFVTFHAYNAENRQANPPRAPGQHTWNNWNKMVADLALAEADIPEPLAKVQWLVRWPK